MATSTGANVPGARSGHTAIWTREEMIIGGVDNSGGRYRPSSDGWIPTSTGGNVPAARQSHTAVWTGGEMIVWGGAPLNPIGGRYCACSAMLPTGALTVAVSKPSVVSGTARISWEAVSGAMSYDAVEGEIDSLISNAGDFSMATQICLASETTATTLDSIPLPATGESFWYLVRAVNCAGVGSYDSGAFSQAGLRDAEIQASGAACP
jgi:hypothetical protein